MEECGCKNNAAKLNNCIKHIPSIATTNERINAEWSGFKLTCKALSASGSRWKQPKQWREQSQRRVLFGDTNEDTGSRPQLKRVLVEHNKRWKSNLGLEDVDLDAQSGFLLRVESKHENALFLKHSILCEAQRAIRAMANRCQFTYFWKGSGKPVASAPQISQSGLRLRRNHFFAHFKWTISIPSRQLNTKQLFIKWICADKVLATKLKSLFLCKVLFRYSFHADSTTTATVEDWTRGDVDSNGTDGEVPLLGVHSDFDSYIRKQCLVLICAVLCRGGCLRLVGFDGCVLCDETHWWRSVKSVWRNTVLTIACAWRQRNCRVKWVAPSHHTELKSLN